MGISLTTGRDSAAETADHNYLLVRELMTRFEERFGSTNCQVLLGCHLGTPEGQAYYKQNHLIERCLGYTEGATEIAMSLIAEQERAE